MQANKKLPYGKGLQVGTFLRYRSLLHPKVNKANGGTASKNDGNTFGTKTER